VNDGKDNAPSEIGNGGVSLSIRTAERIVPRPKFGLVITG